MNDHSYRFVLALSLCLACGATGVIPAPSHAAPEPSSAISAARRRAIVLVKEAEAAFYRGDSSRTLALCRQAIALDARYARAFTWQGAAHEKRGEVAAARAAYQRVVSLSSGSDGAYARGRLRVLDAGPTPPSPPPLRETGATVSSLDITVNGKLLGARGLVGASGRLLVPMRALFEALGAQVSFDGATGAVLARRGDSLVELKPGQSFARRDGQSVVLEEPARLRNGQLIVPLRFAAESLGAVLIPDPVLRRVDVRLAPDPGDSLPSEGPAVAVLPQPALPAASLPPAGPAADELAPPDPPALNPNTDADGVEASDPNATPASRLLLEGGLRLPGVVRVSGVEYSQAHLLRGEDADSTFHLDRAWKYFSVQVAMPDSAPGPWSEFRVWFDDNPAKTPFPPVRIYKGREPLLLLVPVTGVARLSLGPGFPGQPLVLINPRFIRGSARAE